MNGSARKTLLAALLACLVVRAFDKDRTAPGPHPVERIELVDLADPTRGGRPIRTRITAPTGQGPFPVVVMSHGLGGNWASHQRIADHLASHGYLVFALTHPASDTERVFRGTKDWAANPRNPALDPNAVLGRAPDVSFILDRAERWNRDPGHPLRNRIDLEHVGIAGHSFGSFTALTACGARPRADHLRPKVTSADATGLGPSQRDRRVDVAIADAPRGPGGGYFAEGSFATVDCPVLAMSGSADRQGSHYGGKGLPARNRYRGFELMPKGDKHYLWLWVAGHNGWVDPAESSLFAQGVIAMLAPEADDVTRISNALSVAFLDAYLRNDPAARADLTGTYAQTLTGGRIRKVEWAAK